MNAGARETGAGGTDGADADVQARRRRVELFATILLAASAVATAWTTYQSTQWRGEQASASTKATAARVESSQASTHAGQLTQVDVALFAQWLNASAHADTRLAEFYRKRFRSEFQPAFASWVATKPLTSTKAPDSPFSMPQYRVSANTDARRLDARADSDTRRAQSANDRADKYMLGLVLFASALFFGGMATKLASIRQQEVLLGIGGAIFVAAVVLVATFPVMFVT